MIGSFWSKTNAIG